jgi:hypothetical protein
MTKKTKLAHGVDTLPATDESMFNDLQTIRQEETPKKKTKVTKKVIVIRNLEKEGGSTIGHIAQEIVDLGMDSDLEKNKRVVRLWISKIGFKVDSRKEKESGARYYFKAK